MTFDEWWETTGHHAAGEVFFKGLARVAWNMSRDAEREACAKLCDEQAERSEASMLKAKTIKGRDIYSTAGQTAHWNAAAIRARSNNEPQ